MQVFINLFAATFEALGEFIAVRTFLAAINRSAVIVILLSLVIGMGVSADPGDSAFWPFLDVLSRQELLLTVMWCGELLEKFHLL